MNYVERIYKQLQQRNAGETEFLQSAKEIF